MDTHELQTLTADLRKKRGAYFDTMPGWAPKEQLFALALQRINMDTKLRSCTESSVKRAILKSLSSGLSVSMDSDEASLIAYGTECTFSPSYLGLLRLANQSPHVGGVDAEVIYQNDVFIYTKDKDQSKAILHHKPTLTNRGEMIGVWAMYYDMRSQDWRYKVLSRQDVEDQHMRMSKSAASDSGPWKTHPRAMWIKSAIRELCKLMPKSTALAEAMGMEARADSVLDITSEVDTRPLHPKSEELESVEVPE